jgi:hypothetical protein
VKRAAFKVGDLVYMKSKGLYCESGMIVGLVLEKVRRSPLYIDYDLYSVLWGGVDVLRGGVDASIHYSKNLVCIQSIVDYKFI